MESKAPRGFFHGSFGDRFTADLDDAEAIELDQPLMQAWSSERGQTKKGRRFQTKPNS